MKLAGAVIAVALVLAGCGGGEESAAPSWNHDPADSARGPAAWGELDDEFEQCASGEAQSPVDLTAEELTVVLEDLEFDYPETPLTVKNTGHVIEAELPEGGEHTLSIGDDEYRLVQFHFHAPSEHTVDGRSYDGEAHLVHESDDSELAVVAVFLERNAVDSTYVPAVIESAPETAGEEVELEDERSPLELLGVLDATTAVRADYAAYSGSLTTPGCTERVSWIVTGGSLPTPDAAIDRLHELIAGFPGYDGYEDNNRPTQPLNDREVLDGRAG
jgi:carbonic anhydrase